MLIGRLLTTSRLLDLVSHTIPPNIPLNLAHLIKGGSSQHLIDQLAKWPTFDFAHALGLIDLVSDSGVSINPQATNLLYDGLMRCIIKPSRLGPPQLAWLKAPLLYDATLVDLLTALRHYLPPYAHKLASQAIRWQSLISCQDRGPLLRDMQPGDHLTFAFDHPEEAKVVEVQRVEYGYKLHFWVPHPKLNATGLYSYHAYTFDSVSLENASRLLHAAPAELLSLEAGLRWDGWMKRRVYDGPLALRLILLLIFQSGHKPEFLAGFISASKL